MCGICGFVPHDVDQPIDPEMLLRMTHLLYHRGPDSEGYYLKNGIGLGVRRLSIIDVEGGDQPILNEDGSIAVVCNGEIYNYIELRRQLMASGHHFRTHSDIEVINHLYEEHSTDFLNHLRGMFGLALWDAKHSRLILARDRLGIKPMHYGNTDHGLFFASEIKSILSTDRIDGQLDVQSLKDLFTFGFVRTPKTLVAKIRRLPAGHYLTYHQGEMAIHKYWDIPFPHRDHADLRRSTEEWAEALREKLTESIRIHLRSDVPVGAWLSPGVDSSAVAELMHQITNQAIHVFTLRFENPDFDELIDQKNLDDYFPNSFLSHRETCRNGDFRLFPKALWHCEDPFMAGVEIPRLILSELSSQKVKVVLTGEGSDEILGGYSWYWTDKLLRPVSSLPFSLRRMMASFPLSNRKWPGASQILLAPREMNLSRYACLIGPAGAMKLQDEIFSKDLKERLDKDHSEDKSILPEHFLNWHPFTQLQYYDLKLRLPDCVVHHLDRGSMAYSLEARVPFLDHELVEFCSHIPPFVKMKRLQEKYILRRSMKKFLPREILRRKKRPLSAPVHQWFRGGLPDFAEDLLSKQRLRENGFFNPECVERMLNQHRSGKENFGKILLGILGIQLWNHLFIRDFPTVGRINHALLLEGHP